MTDRKLLEQALESLENVRRYDKESLYELDDDITALNERLAKPEPDPLINPTTCTWTHDDDEGSWDAECGERWSITEGTPEENNFRFCPGCGKTIKTIYSNRTEVNDE